jgi:mono/diheme cytochrome c family protein
MFVLIAAIASGVHADDLGKIAEGRATFQKQRCNACHSVYGEVRPGRPAQYPLRDLSKESAEAVANLILSRGELDPHNMFDEQAMSICVSGMRRQELTAVVAYLRAKHGGVR